VNIDLGNGIVLSWGQVVASARDDYGTTTGRLISSSPTPRIQRRFEIRAALEHAEVKGSIPGTVRFAFK
jgi:hypothetical protein